MEEIKGILTTQKMFNVTFNEYESVIKKELGVVVAIDNENEFKGVFTKYGEVDVFKQLLSQEVSRHYTKYKAFPYELLIPYKDCGDIIFDFIEVTYGKMYGGYVYVVHYIFASTACSFTILIMITAADRIKITAQIAVLKEIALEYNGKTIDNVIQQLELRLAD